MVRKITNTGIRNYGKSTSKTKAITAEQHTANRRARKAEQKADAKANAFYREGNIDSSTNPFTIKMLEERSEHLRMLRKQRENQACQAKSRIDIIRKSTSMHTRGSYTRVKANEACDIAEMLIDEYVNADPTFATRFGTGIKDRSINIATEKIRSIITPDLGQRMVESAISIARDAIILAINSEYTEKQTSV